jgi:hypothetical protein
VAEAQRHYAAARDALARIKMRGRAGELLATWPANAAAEDLRVTWIRAAQDEFASGHGASLLSAAQIYPDHGAVFGPWMMMRHLFTAALRPLWPGREILDVDIEEIRPLQARRRRPVQKTPNLFSVQTR